MGALTFLLFFNYFFLKVNCGLQIVCVLSKWGEILIPMYRLWLYGLYGLHRPSCPLSWKRPLNLSESAGPYVCLPVCLSVPRCVRTDGRMERRQSVSLCVRSVSPTFLDGFFPYKKSLYYIYVKWEYWSTMYKIKHCHVAQKWSIAWEYVLRSTTFYLDLNLQGHWPISSRSFSNKNWWKILASCRVRSTARTVLNGLFPYMAQVITTVRVCTIHVLILKLWYLI